MKGPNCRRCDDTFAETLLHRLQLGEEINCVALSNRTQKADERTRIGAARPANAAEPMKPAAHGTLNRCSTTSTNGKPRTTPTRSSSTSDSPTRPFTFIRTLKPNWWMFRDCTLFVDDDGSAWLVYASDDNATLVINRLSDDYLEPTPIAYRLFPGRYMEAPCVFKHDGRYYLIASDCTGWHPNEARSASAPSLAGRKFQSAPP